MVDLGCGKAKALLVASEFGFKEVRGVELSTCLYDIAKNNCSIYKNKTKTNTEFKVIRSNVIDYKMNDDEDIFYLYNPFNEYILDKVIDNIAASHARVKRKIWIIYGDPLHKETIEKKMKPTTVLELTFWGLVFVVFEIE
ncbi:MAG: hypothetical protein D3924_03595 [Candidatus Electrothrix sp. AR4]|nr:hypothetical protein [Candidatus Electrothrix sp. AR4]